MKESLSPSHRLLTAIVGLLIGGILGMLALYFTMFAVGSDFGLDNVRLGMVTGVAIGFLCGLLRPRRWSWLDFINP